VVCAQVYTSHRQCCFVQAKVSGGSCQGRELLFASEKLRIQSLGLDGVDSIVSVDTGGTVMLPVCNFQKHSVSVPAHTELGQLELLEGSPESLVSTQVSVTCASVAVEGNDNDTSKLERFSQLIEALELPLSNCSTEQLQALQSLLYKYSGVFALSATELGCSNLVQHVIDTGASSPIKQHPYRTPFIQREKVAQLIAEMRELGIVQPSSSAWASPVVLVQRKMGPPVFVWTTGDLIM